MFNKFNRIITSFNLSGVSVEKFCELNEYTHFTEKHRDIIVIPDLNSELYIAKNSFGIATNIHEERVFKVLNSVPIYCCQDLKFLLKPLVTRLEKVDTVEKYTQLSRLTSLIVTNFIVIQLKFEDFGFHNGNIVLMNALTVIPKTINNTYLSLLICDHCYSKIQQNINYILLHGNLCQNCKKPISIYNTSILQNVESANLKEVISNGN